MGSKNWRNLFFLTCRKDPEIQVYGYKRAIFHAHQTRFLASFQKAESENGRASSWRCQFFAVWRHSSCAKITKRKKSLIDYKDKLRQEIYRLSRISNRWLAISRKVILNLINLDSGINNARLFKVLIVILFWMKKVEDFSNRCLEKHVHLFRYNVNIIFIFKRFRKIIASKI